MSDNDKPTCPICGGEGAVTAFGSYESADGTQPCQACSGTGEREETAIDEFIENAISIMDQARALIDYRRG